MQVSDHGPVLDYSFVLARQRLAAQLLAATLSSGRTVGDKDWFAHEAVALADALLARLGREETESAVAQVTRERDRYRRFLEQLLECEAGRGDLYDLVANVKRALGRE